ncbi:recombinase family protein [Lawsonibacter faecis]|uniref:Recombinase family protein n=1 Tax=Lawsonibacter faecis TaxID=2763052 RepID=A0A8J6JEW1_9FIRM|nr:recombinase family protein [Lawsonibacter faecis]MBC5738311.1 recombinase family protein [Lawsonibacter faecis]
MGYIPYGFVQKPAGIFIEPQQAKVVQQIYQRYLAGDSLEGIADFLFQNGIPSPQGKERWTRPIINCLLSNEKYAKYIISSDDYSTVQIEKEKRSNIDKDTGKRKATRYSSQNVLSGLLVCSECGANYRRITRPSGEVVWRCANRVEHGKRICKHSPSISEVLLREDICKLLEMDSFHELNVEKFTEGIHVQENGTLEINYKEQEFSLVMRG